MALLYTAGLRAEEEYRLRIDESKPMLTVRGGTFSLKHRTRVRNGREDALTDWQPVWWQLPADFEAGEYYVGAECVREGAWDDCQAVDWLYHNGERFHFDQWTPPASEPGKLWSATAFCRTPRAFEPGDVLGLKVVVNRHRGVVLARRLPALSRLETGSTFPWRRPAFHRWPDALAQLDLKRDGDQTRIEAAVHFYGESPASFPVAWELTDFYGAPLDRGVAEVNLSALQTWKHTFSPAIPDHIDRAVFRLEPKLTAGQARGASVDIVKGRKAGPRPRIYLHGLCDAAIDERLFLESPPAADAFTKRARIPGSTPASKGHHIGWYRRTVEIPDTLRVGRVFLRFRSAQVECAVYVNGKPAGRHLGMGDSFEFDITPWIKPGDNEITIGVRDWIAAVDEEELRKADRSKPWSLGTFRNFIMPIQRANRPVPCGIFDDVYLEARPELHVADAFVRPSVRRNRLEVDLQLANRAALETAVTPRVRILDRGTRIAEATGTKLTLAPGASATTTLELDAATLPRWWPHDPHLLQCRVALEGSPDVYDVRFGMREVWFEGADLLLNGKPVHAIRGHIGGAHQVADPAVFRRNHHAGDQDYALKFGETARAKPSLVDLCDEFGYLVDLETLQWIVQPTTEKLTSDVYWGNAERMAVATVRTFRNNASVIHYDHANEFACYAPYTNVDDGYEFASRRLYGVIEAVRKIDPTRPSHTDADTDLNGRLPDFNLHYPHTMRFFGTTHAGRTFMLPEDIFQGWFVDPPADFVPKKGSLIKTSSNGIPAEWAYGERPAYAAEVLWYAGMHLIKGATFFVGDRAFLGSGSAWDAEAERSYTFVNGFRHIGMWAVHPWTCGGEASAPGDDIVPIEDLRHYYGGEQAERHCNIHHDYLYPAELILEWGLRRGGRETRAGSERLSLRGGDLVRRRLTFTLPNVDEPEAMELVYRLRDGDKVRIEKTQSVTVFPRSAPKITGRVSLWDPPGHSAEALRKLGLRVDRVAEPTEAKDNDSPVLVVGPAALTKANEGAAGKALFRFAENGGTVVMLRQDRWPATAPVTLSVDEPRVSSRIWKRAPGHAVFAGIDDGWLWNWQPGHVVSSCDFVKPTGGNLVVLADSGAKHGLERACLIDLRYGRGRLLLCQMHLVEAFGKEPVAPRLLANLVSVAMKEAEELRPLTDVQLIAPKDSPVRGLFTALGVHVNDAARPLVADGSDREAAILVQLGKPLRDSEAEALRSFASGGGFVWVRGVSAATLPALESITGISWRQAPPVPACWEGRALLSSGAAELAGLSHQEFFWRQNIATAFSKADYKLADLATFRIEPADPGTARPLLDPADMWVMPVGRGRVLIDQVRWAENAQNVNITPSAKRIACAILTAAGVAVDPPYSVAGQPLPENVGWVPVDLSPWANMGFKDDVESDAKGGWTDQGPNMDLRNLPTGKLEFNDVPFFIHPTKGCLTLGGPHQPARNRIAFEIKGITIDRELVALELLHTGAWVSNGAGTFTMQVNYKDGTFARVPSTGGINSVDWTKVRNHLKFPLETDTRTRAAWVGPGSGVFPVVGVLQSRWVNPNPGKKVTTVDFIRTRFFQRAGENGEKIANCVGTIAGLTIGVEGESQRDDDPRSPAELLQAIQAARQRGASDKAIELARLLTRKAPQQTENWNLLGDLYLEKGDKRAALKAFKKSLEINWNQPPTMEEVEKLETELK